MVERVAQAICGDDNPANILAIHRIRAVAAIQAMREPTNSMLKAAAKSMSPEHRPTPEYLSVKEKHRARYRAMIDAALGGEKLQPVNEENAA
jgi:hypothetical protein